MAAFLRLLCLVGREKSNDRFEVERRARASARAGGLFRATADEARVYVDHIDDGEDDATGAGGADRRDGAEGALRAS